MSVPPQTPSHREGDQPARDRLAAAEKVRQACIHEALRAYEDAKIRGICHEGAWECAVSALRGLDVEAILASGEG